MKEMASGVLGRRPLLAVCALAVLLLSASLGFADMDFVLTSGLGHTTNDQVGYITTARHLAEHGSLRSSLVYPSVLYQQPGPHAFYVPGHYLSLAASFQLLGYSPWSAFVPNLLGYVLASCALFVATRRLYDRTTAWLAAVVFMTFPAHLVYSATAMAEMTLLAAFTGCFAIFVLVPNRWKPWVGPLLLFVPVAFRETAAVLLLPMAAVLFVGSSRDRSRPLARVALLVLLSLGVVAWEVSWLFGDRPSLFKANVFSGAFFVKYGDAFFQEQLSPSLQDWAVALSHKVAANLASLLIFEAQPRLQVGSLWFAIATIPVAAVLALRDRDWLLGSFSVATAALVAALLLLYDIAGWKGVRILLISVPFAAIVLGRLLPRLFPRVSEPRLVAATLCLGAVVALAGLVEVAPNDALRTREEADVAFLESLDHDPRRLLVAPYWISLQYVLRSFPVTWSFLPADRRSLARLAGAHPIGTIVLPPAWHPWVRLSREDVLASGFVPEGRRVYQGMPFEIFRSP